MEGVLGVKTHSVITLSFIMAVFTPRSAKARRAQQKTEHELRNCHRDTLQNTG